MPQSKKTRTSMQRDTENKPSRRERRHKTNTSQKAEEIDGGARQAQPEHRHVKLKTNIPHFNNFNNLYTVNEEDDEDFDFSNLAQRMPERLPRQLLSADFTTTIKATPDDKDAMLNEILFLTNQLAQLSEVTIKQEDSDNKGEANVEARLLDRQYRNSRADCFAQKVVWNYFDQLPTHIREFNLHHLCSFVDLQVVTFRLACANHRGLSVHMDTTHQQCVFDRKQLRIFSFLKVLLQSGEDWTPVKIMLEARKIDRSERRNMKRSAAQNSEPPSHPRHISTKKERQLEAARIRIGKESRGDQGWFEASLRKFSEDIEARRSAKVRRRQERELEKAWERQERGIDKKQQRALHAERRETGFMLSNLMYNMGIDDQNKKSHALTQRKFSTISSYASSPSPYSPAGNSAY